MGTNAGNAAKHEVPPSEPLEQYDDAPLYIFRREVEPERIVKHNGYTSYQVNVAGTGGNITGDAANEPSICVDPTNINKKAVGWRQFDSAASNFRQAGWGYTNNGGTTWTFPGVLQDGVFRSDPVLASDETGRFFYLSLLETFFDDLWRSLNGGISWSLLAPATGGDKQWFTIDKTNSSGHGFQYQCWSTAGNNYGGRQFSRSTNGGISWGEPVNIPNSPVWGTLDVDTNGNLFIGGIGSDTGQVLCIRSSNAKNSAVTPTFDQSTNVNLGGDIISGRVVNPAGIIGQLYLAVDRSGTVTNNNVYMMASVQPDGATNGTGTDVMFVRSTDGGQTFSAPKRVNSDPVNHSKWHWFASLSVAPNGRIDAVWLDTRNAANNIDSQLYYSYSFDGGNTWSTNIPVSDQFDPRIGYPNQNKMGDYMSSTSDNAGVDVAYTATFNGEQDIFYVRLAPVRSQLLNISSRALVLNDDRVTIAGFIINGTEPKRVIIRGIGPSLGTVAGALADPTLELHQGSNTLATNDNWKVKSDGTSQEAEVIATTLPPTNDLESAIVMTLNPGQYTAILAGKNRGTGVGLVEVFDLARETNSKLANLSTRAFTGTGSDALIGGFIIGGGGGGGARVIVRAIGTSLGVQGPLLDPTLELHDANGVTTATNDNWKTTDGSLLSQEAEIRATTLQPSSDFESALIATLAPGPHTAVVRGKNNTTGVALVEVFSLP